MPENLFLPIDALVRSVGVNKSSPHALFLGAGASISSGIPSAARCIWEWKRDIFLTNNPAMRDHFSELSLPSVQERIQRWLEANNHPKLNDPSEYSHYIEWCYPIPEDRRSFFQSIIAKARPHTGYRHLAILAEANLIRAVWTTNFDALTAKACVDSEVVAIEVGIDCQGRLPRMRRSGELMCVSMHGDYRYDPLKNTVEELQQQEEQLRLALIEELSQTHLIVCGYSGRDESLMAALLAAYSKPGSGTLYWCGHGDATPPASVENLILEARRQKRAAYYVPAQGFDDLMTRLTFRCLDGDRLKKAQAIAEKSGQQELMGRSPFRLDRIRSSTIIKSNAFPIECPNELLEFVGEGLPDSGIWRWLREKAEGHQVVAVPQRGKILALGTIDGIKDAFRGHVKGSIDRTPIDVRELSFEDGAVTHLLLTALVQVLAQNAGLQVAGRRIVWGPREQQRDTVDGIACVAYPSAELTLRKGQHLIVLPSLVIRSPSGEMVPREIEKKLRQKILGYQHNNKFNQAVNGWRKLLFAEDTTVVEYPPDCGSSFRFLIQKAPVFAKIGDSENRRGANLPAKIERMAKQTGLQIAEPSLIFCHRNDTNSKVRDTHPVRGIIDNRPFDFSLTRRGLAEEVNVGVICPVPESRPF